MKFCPRDMMVDFPYWDSFKGGVVFVDADAVEFPSVFVYLYAPPSKPHPLKNPTQTAITQ